MKVTLRIQEFPGASQTEVEINGTSLIGRNDECDITLQQPKVSREHARVVVEQGEVRLVDLKSANGIYVGNQKLQPGSGLLLKDGMTFRIGTATFELEIEDNDLSENYLWFRVEEGTWKKQGFSDTVLIGRGESCDLFLDEEHVSREHCRIFVRGNRFFIEDLGSHNGTYLEQNKIVAEKPQLFQPGQYLRIGHTTLTLAEARQQHKYESKVNRYQTGEGYEKRSQKQAPSTKTSRKIWPFIVGSAALMMACVCIFVVVGVFLLDNSKPIPTEVANITQDNQLDDPTIVPEVNATKIPEGLATETVLPVEDEKADWLVLLYQNADDENLEEDIVFDVNSAEYVGSDENVKIVTQLDRYNGSYAGDGDWAQSRRYILETGGDLEQIESNVAFDLGEVDSGDVQTLIDFVLWGVNEYPAEHVILIMSDHGGGWFGGYTDGDNENVDGIYLPALDSALAYILNQSGIGKFDIIGFDACLMAQLEVYSILIPYAEIAVASEETESATGWAYAAFLKKLVENPKMSAEELSTQIVATFVEEDIYYQYYDYDPDYTMGTSTLSAFDLSKVMDVNLALNGFIKQLQSVDPSIIAEARNYTRSYLLYDDYVPSFLDLVNFANMVCVYSGDQTVCQETDVLSEVLAGAVISEKHGESMNGSNGLSFYFPDADFFEITMDDTYGYAYRQHAERFTTDSLWDEFLDFHYLGRSMP